MFKPIKVPSIDDLIFQQMIELIKSGHLTASERLPTAGQMAESFGLSKTQVKSALTRLEHFGVIIIKPQSGAYLANYSAPILIKLIENQLDMEEVKDQDLREVRHQLESHAVRLLAQQADESIVQQLQGIHDQFVMKVMAGERAVDEDFYFHFMLVKLAGNSALSAIYSYLAPAIINFWYQLEAKGSDIVRLRAKATIEEHQAVLEALKLGDVASAQLAMDKHIEKAHQVLMM